MSGQLVSMVTGAKMIENDFTVGYSFTRDFYSTNLPIIYNSAILTLLSIN